jgi:ABC-type sugar transport system ATPase subunit
VGNPSINFIGADCKEGSDGSLECVIFDTQKAKFVPSAPLHLVALQSAIKKELEEKAALKEALKLEPGYVEKSNKDKPFKFSIPKIEEETPLDVLTDTIEPVHKSAYILGVRPEYILIRPSGKLTAKVYSAMPAGMETTVKIQVGKYLLTGVVFGGVNYKTDAEVHFDIVGSDVLLFESKSQKLVAAGKLTF